MICNRIQRLIDEADRAEVLPFAAASHIAICPACSRFADERTKLRAFLIDIPRISAPTNFDAMLKTRLAESKTAKSFSWFAPALAMRFGAVAAVALIAVFTVPYLNNSPAPYTASSVIGSIYTPKLTMMGSLQEPRDNVNLYNPTGRRDAPVVVAYTSKAGRKIGNSTKPVDDLANTPIIIIPADGQETVSMPMMPVSVGAQQQMMMRGSRSAPKTLAVSF